MPHVSLPIADKTWVHLLLFILTTVQTEQNTVFFNSAYDHIMSHQIKLFQINHDIMQVLILMFLVVCNELTIKV